MKYKIIEIHYSSALEELVNEALAEGWVLLGGVSVAQSEDLNEYHRVFAQAMTKEE